ncbi:trypsin-like peptidase domain-containing protein [Mesorhizobium sp. LSJC264A00]|uniref:trypsin-like peptidase domain-containing protein n=1 Tax=unclassified Mesorhizobium TaxID=325217 RepID=UPI0004135E36|nr:trypsin-like peptidase domain-containing protein [Mesorhizobium sp. LSJC264A00]
MARWKKYLKDPDLRAIAEAAIASGLATPEILTALLRQIPRSFTGLLPGFPLPPNLRLRADLDFMNRVHNLVTGEVPLAIFLSTMIESTGDAAAIGVFETELAKVKALEQAPLVVTSDAIAGAASDDQVQPGGPYLTTANREVSQEAQISEFDETLAIRYLRMGALAAGSVFKIVIHRHINGEAEFITDDRPRLSNGTGWVIAPGLGITNHHVVNARSALFGEGDATVDDFRLQAETAKVRFDYFEVNDIADGVVLGPGALLASDAELDFALLQLPNAFGVRPPLRLRQQKIGKRLDQPLGTRVNVLQHPNGSPMRLGFRNNFVVLGDDNVLAYLTDTASGSSGSPVCDDAWSVAALHYGSRGVSDQNLKLMGRLVKQENVGTPIPQILKHLAANHASVHKQIVDGQAGLKP